ncbi:MAG: Ni/Fe hydrogenase subunit alpha [Elusimicrobiota bacterium]
MKKITIDPITRLEGHGKIEIFLDEQGNVQSSYLQIPELRGFEKFCEGRLAEDMPQLTSRICGVCPVAHHFASTKALDMAFGVEPTSTAKKLRELMYCGYIIYDHILHFYFLAAPDFVVGPAVKPSERNIIGIINKLGVEIGKEVIKHRAFGQKITEILGGKATHPVCGLPGGISKGLTEEERIKIEKMLVSCLEFSKTTLKLFEQLVLSNEKYKSLVTGDVYKLETYYMGLVDDKNQLNFYDGKIRVVTPDGKEFVKFSPANYLDIISERVESWTYSKMTYLKKLGHESGTYKVGALARLNVSDKIATPLAAAEFTQMYKFFGRKPVHNSLAYHWSRIVELLYASERGLELVRDKEITSPNLRNSSEKNPGEGIGIVEAARGTLIHHYKLTKDGLIEKLNLIVPTTSNSAAINSTINIAAKNLIKNGEVSEGLLNMVEMAYRAYDPCFACATHLFGERTSLTINIYDSRKKLIKKITK